MQLRKDAVQFFFRQVLQRRVTGDEVFFKLNKSIGIQFVQHLDIFVDLLFQCIDFVEIGLGLATSKQQYNRKPAEEDMSFVHSVFTIMVG